MPKTLVELVNEWNSRTLYLFASHKKRDWDTKICQGFSKRQYLYKHVKKKNREDHSSLTMRQTAIWLDQNAHRNLTVSQYLTHVKSGDTQVRRRRARTSQANVRNVRARTDTVQQMVQMTNAMAPARTIAATQPRAHAREESLENFRGTRAPQTLEQARVTHATNVAALRNPPPPRPPEQPTDPGVRRLRERQRQEDIQNTRYLNGQIRPRGRDNTPITGYSQGSDSVVMKMTWTISSGQ